MNTLARPEKVDLRDQWKDEAKDFTPWFAEPENIEILSEAIGMDLEVIGKDNQSGFESPKVQKRRMQRKWPAGMHAVFIAGRPHEG